MKVLSNESYVVVTLNELILRIVCQVREIVK